MNEIIKTINNNTAAEYCYYEGRQQIKHITYFKKIKDCISTIRHREDGAAFIQFFHDGKIRHEGYWINGKLHREGGPAWINYDEEGNIIEERWYVNHKVHREDGPAYIIYYSKNSKSEHFWINDKRVQEDMFEEYLKKWKNESMYE